MTACAGCGLKAWLTELDCTRHACACIGTGIAGHALSIAHMVIMAEIVPMRMLSMSELRMPEDNADRASHVKWKYLFECGYECE